MSVILTHRRRWAFVCTAYGAYHDMISEFFSPASAVALALARQAGGDLMDLADSLEQRTTALTVSDVAELLNISGRQVYKLASDGSLPSFRIGGSVRFNPSAMAAWLRSTEKLGPTSVDAKGQARARRA
jgi:excisionase family DNA binding protein